MLKTFRLISVVVGASLLSACGGAPSESEMKEVMKNHNKKHEMTMQNLGVGGDMFKSLTPEFKDLSKIACNKDGDKAYMCDVEITMSVMGQTTKHPSRLRFVKKSDGWVIGG